ncbi:4-(cytidine 5'-diphospho)-2-C-methyl-D-erythritol kinase [Syntrophus aciditrophicus]|uniref:4-diphosphocytidyl-2-C-methyl-D-erythritol kinase n=1 Tax=Syntrophus aciditrophicus (strain SB) TaxID=56780 RepID=ISPE_SYNAS|nr:4-(cytidine 5'-diphospho)-2-C-methyl-D-erythritol kinase [Syntrophus aciditrophicus]Q2LUJ9.1 RecName: Full=4-diphosphocytidyl-2-C-methyl-D-erythritol kinase; Short=CMK; AltName: Full=4-(cytidine-5'-diphospho)-2-C-methyl-D-erythritol kinase [Syntrophus aciditrophicus SB]ABC77763.1 4-diphosphocytidyl-2-C-methyl-D-erythritol kinase [Syntrophus aciditrophicus SB]
MLKILSPAKVNLHLRVLRKREDNYHDLATLMQKVSLYDELEFQPSNRGIQLRCPGFFLPENEENIVFRAAKKILSFSGCPTGVTITLRKNIPLAAGLGGGSSNAAMTLLALNKLFRLNFSTGELMKIGATLGADVPFFLFHGPAWAYGIGDRLKAALDVPKVWFVLINPGFEVSTRVIYEKLNLGLTKEIIHYSIPRFLSMEDMAAGLHNDLESVTLKMHPSLQEIKDLLCSYGAAGALMSGSGPTVFGIFENEDKAKEAETVLGKPGTWAVFCVRSID